MSRATPKAPAPHILPPLGPLEQLTLRLYIDALVTSYTKISKLHSSFRPMVRSASAPDLLGRLDHSQDTTSTHWADEASLGPVVGLSCSFTNPSTDGLGPVEYRDREVANDDEMPIHRLWFSREQKERRHQTGKTTRNGPPVQQSRECESTATDGMDVSLFSLHSYWNSEDDEIVPEAALTWAFDVSCMEGGPFLVLNTQAVKRHPRD